MASPLHIFPSEGDIFPSEGDIFRAELLKKWRGRVGIEPTQDSFYLPHSGFEDRAPHQRCSIPTLFIIEGIRLELFDRFALDELNCVLIQLKSCVIT